VTPYLVGLKPSDLKGPLVQFQATESTKRDTRRLIGTLNKALGETALPEKQLDKTFEIWWPELDDGLQRVQSAKTPQRPQRRDRDILEEILALVRDQAKRMPQTFEGNYIADFPQLGSPYVMVSDGQLRHVVPRSLSTIGRAIAVDPKRKVSVSSDEPENGGTKNENKTDTDASTKKQTEKEK
jgi:hypothetical protein